MNRPDPCHEVEDYPRAAIRHEQDSASLFEAGRYDGSAYLAGYVVECSTKALLEMARTHVPGGTEGHIPNLASHIPKNLARNLSLHIKAARVAKVCNRYVGAIRPKEYARIQDWWCTCRGYERPGLDKDTTRRIRAEATRILNATIHAMVLDRVLDSRVVK